MDFDALMGQGIARARERVRGQPEREGTGAGATTGGERTGGSAETLVRDAAAVPARDTPAAAEEPPDSAPVHETSIPEARIDARLRELGAADDYLSSTSLVDKLFRANELSREAALAAAVAAQHELEASAPPVTVENAAVLESPLKGKPHAGYKKTVARVLPSLRRFFREAALELPAPARVPLVPLLQELRLGTVSREQLPGLVRVVAALQAQDALGAEQAYLQLSIGNKAWPLGIGAVSIHERPNDYMLYGNQDTSGREWMAGVRLVVRHMEGAAGGFAKTVEAGQD